MANRADGATALSYFYPMQKTLQQLDLFGFPIEATVQPRKKEKTVKAITASVETPALIEKEVAPEVAVAPVPVQEATEKAAMAADEPIRLTRTASPKKITVSKTAGKRGRKSFKEMDSEADLIEVPEEDVLRQKLYYSISEVAGWFKVNTSLLRYWENEFDILQPRKTRKGDRLFRVEDIKNLQLIYFLLRQRKFSIDGAKNYLKNNKKEADTQVKLMESLTRFKSFLLELKTNLQA